MSIARLLTHRMDVEAIASPAPRDTSGGIIDSGFAAAQSNVPCAITSLSAADVNAFASAGERVTHSVVTLASGIAKGQRLKVVDGFGTTYLRVQSVQPVRKRGSIGPFYKLMGEEIVL